MMHLLLTWYCPPRGHALLLFQRIPTTMNVHTLLPALTAWLLMHAARANNIQVGNTQFTANTATSATIRFDLSWENSWRGSGVINWDAAWVFVKYKQSNGVWRHARLAESGHAAPAGSMIDNGLLTPGAAYHATQNPVVGVFIRRDADGTGTFIANGVQLLWDHGAQGIVTVNDILEVRVFAIEMVYVNEGPFRLGDGSSHATFRTGSTPNPYLVDSEAAIPMNASTGLWSDLHSVPGTLPAAFPKGHHAFYCMKYELSQQQYVDFLNCLTRVQQNARVETNVAPGVTSVTDRYVMQGSAAIVHRSVIRCDAAIDPQAAVHFYCDANGNGTGGEADDGQWIVMTKVSPVDLASYLDWSGLRIMTELEYEKACRGPLPPVPGEYAWGNALVEVDDDYVLENMNTAQEGIAGGYRTTSGNAVMRNGLLPATMGPVRVGIFAANPANTGRMTSGASYYGAMELTGNAFDLVIGMVLTLDLSYTGQHGNGELGSAGSYDVTNWPAAAPGEGASPFNFRGGHEVPGTLNVHGTVSHRGYYVSNPAQRGNAAGGRGIRTAQ